MSRLSPLLLLLLACSADPGSKSALDTGPTYNPGVGEDGGQGEDSGQADGSDGGTGGDSGTGDDGEDSPVIEGGPDWWSSQPDLASPHHKVYQLSRGCLWLDAELTWFVDQMWLVGCELDASGTEATCRASLEPASGEEPREEIWMLAPEDPSAAGGGWAGSIRIALGCEGAGWDDCSEEEVAPYGCEAR